MATEEEIRNVIQERKSIVYTCEPSERHIDGERFGDPHILYEAKSGATMVQIWKTGGVQTKYRNELPDWRSYLLSDLVITSVADKFELQKTFNSHGTRYPSVLCSVDRNE